MLGQSALMGFVPTVDLSRAGAFYRDLLGLRPVGDNPYAVVFDANGTMLRVTLVEKLTPPPYTVLGWRVDDIVATARDLTGRGVRFLRYDGMEQDEHGIWTTPGGDRVAWFHDPDGNTLSLTEFSSHT